jgi:hypothetical protein
MKTRNAWVAVGVLAIVLAAGAAPAAVAGEFTASSNPISLVGEQIEGSDVWTIDGSKVECGKGTWERPSLAVPTKTVSGIAASSSECTAFGFTGATFNMGTCTIELLQPTSMAGNLAIRCGAETANKKPYINIRASFLNTTCEVDVGESGNTNLADASYTNNSPTNGKVKINATLTGITMNRTVDNGFCPLNGTGVITNGSYSGKRTLYGNSGVNFSLNP